MIFSWSRAAWAVDWAQEKSAPRMRMVTWRAYLVRKTLSSAAASLLRLVRGQEHYGAVPLGGAYFGCVSRMTRFGPELRREALAPALRAELEKTYAALEAFEY